MQQPIRYYITKSGEEPTVRSVKVARSAPTPRERMAASAPTRSSEHSTTSQPQDSAARREGVKRLLRGAIRRRALDA